MSTTGKPQPFVLNIPGLDRLQTQKQMDQEAIRLNQKMIRETGHDPLWWKLIRNPAFRKAVEAADARPADNSPPRSPKALPIC